MLSLILAIASSSLISILMRCSGARVKNNMIMFMANYGICALLSLGFGLGGGSAFAGEGAGFALGLGVISGIMFLGSFMLLQLNIRRSGVVLSATFMKLGVLVPTLMAVVVYREQPVFTQTLGFVLALAAILLINGGKSEKKSGGAGIAMLVILLIAGGFTDSLSNIYDKGGAPALKDLYLMCTFAVAGLLSAALAVKEHQRPNRTDLMWGVLIGVPNYFSSLFVLLALRELPAVVVFPVFNIGVILIVTITGVLAFGEKLSKRQLAGMGVILAALTLLNI